jgi:TonB family protein
VHVRRRDWLATIGEEIWCALLWFHPAARVIASRLSLARETVVDHITIQLTRDRRAYAEALLAFSDPQPYVIGATPFIGRRTLSQRISLIAQEDSMSRFRAISSLAIAIAVAGGMTVSAVDRFPMSAPGSAQSRVYEPGDGVTLPEVVHEVKPEYTPQAMQAKIQGSVWMLIVVGSSGDVTDAQISRSLDQEFGLDDKALEAAHQWRFRPGTRDGKPVAVRVTVEMRFTLK